MRHINQRFGVAIILMCAAILQSSCINNQTIVNKQTVSPPIPTLLASHTVIACTQPASFSPTPSTIAKTKFPLSADDFASQYHVEYMRGGWNPTSILNYVEDWTQIPEVTVSHSKWQIVSSDNSSIQVNEITWVDDNTQPNGYRVDDPSHEIKAYPFDNDIGIWLLTGSSGFYKISVADLESYVRSDYNQYTVWNYTVKDGKVVVLTEQYIP